MSEMSLHYDVQCEALFSFSLVQNSIDVVVKINID